MAAGGSAWFALGRTQRRNALRNYGAVLGLPPGDPRVRRTARSAFRNYGQTLADFMVLAGLTPAELGRRMTISGLDNLEAGLALGRGCIMAAPHMGSWDLAVSYAGSLGYRVSGVTDPFPDAIDDLVVATRSRFGMRVIPFGRGAVRSIQQELAANGVVCLLCDIPHGPGVEVTFFGRRAVVPGGPAAFACKNRSPIMTAFSYRTGPGRYHVHLDPPLRPEGEGREAQRVLMQGIVTRFEEFIRERPEQWFAFRDLFS